MLAIPLGLWSASCFCVLLFSCCIKIDDMGHFRVRRRLNRVSPPPHNTPVSSHPLTHPLTTIPIQNEHRNDNSWTSTHRSFISRKRLSVRNLSAPTLKSISKFPYNLHKMVNFPQLSKSYVSFTISYKIKIKKVECCWCFQFQVRKYFNWWKWEARNYNYNYHNT